MKLNRLTMLQRVFFGLPAALILLLALGGCGFKTLPVAPQTVVPTAITDLRYELSEKGVTLFWSYPIETISGDDLTEIANFVLYRAVMPADSYCDTCPIPFGKPIALPGGALPGEGRKTATYEATLLRPGNLYFFKVRSTTGWLAESADSNLVSFIWQIPPMAPTDLTVEVKDSAVVMNWQPVTAHIDGTSVTEPVRYQVSRSLGGASFENIGEAVVDTEFTDTSVSNGRKYFYRVQAVTVYDKGTVGGGFSESIAATPVDQTPPAPPADVKAVHTASGIKIFWNSVQDNDLKGYRIYRRLPGNSVPVKVGEVSAQFTLYDDQSAPENAVRLFYSVSSIDGNNPPNESVSSPEVMILK
jgi:hypothetical protein